MSPKYLPNFTAFYTSHQVYCEPHPQCGELRHPSDRWTQQEGSEGARLLAIARFTLSSSLFSFLRCSALPFHCNAIAVVGQYGSVSSLLLFSFVSQYCTSPFLLLLLLLSWSACLAEGPGPCYLCKLIMHWLVQVIPQLSNQSKCQHSRRRECKLNFSETATSQMLYSDNLKILISMFCQNELKGNIRAHVAF